MRCGTWRAKADGLPLWRYMGALDPQVLAYASGLDASLSDDRADAVLLREWLPSACGPASSRSDSTSTQTMRRLGLMHDALGGTAGTPDAAWSTPTSTGRRNRRSAVMRELERDYDIAWCEEPVIRTDLDGLRDDLAGSINAAVATGESLKDIRLFAALLRHGAVDVVQVNPNMGGSDPVSPGGRARRRVRSTGVIHELGRALRRPSRRRAPHHTMMEVLDAGRDAVFTYDSTIENGLDRARRQPRRRHHVRRRSAGAAPSRQIRPNSTHGSPRYAAGGPECGSIPSE